MDMNRLTCDSLKPSPVVSPACSFVMSPVMSPAYVGNGGAVGGFLLLESGGFVLQEGGGRVKLESE